MSFRGKKGVEGQLTGVRRKAIDFSVLSSDRLSTEIMKSRRDERSRWCEVLMMDCIKSVLAMNEGMRVMKFEQETGNQNLRATNSLARQRKGHCCQPERD